MCSRLASAACVDVFVSAWLHSAACVDVFALASAAFVDVFVFAFGFGCVR